MMRRAILSLTLLLCSILTNAAPRKYGTLINYGIKGGFSSTIYEVNDFVVADMPINEYVAKSEISSFYTAFARINIKSTTCRPK